MEQIEKKIKFQAFGKSTLKRKESMRKVVEEVVEEGNDNDKAKELLEKQNSIIESEIKKIKEDKRGKVGQIYKITKVIKGKDNNNAHAILDPDSKKLIVERDKIKKVSLEYCKKVLKKNKPVENMMKLVATRKDLNEQRMKEDTTEGFEADKEAFDEVVMKFKTNNKINYDFLVKASDEYKDAVFHMCKRFLKSEVFPKKFQETTLHQIWKRKPGTRKEDLTANRYIHCKEWLPRTAESMVVKGMEREIKAATNRFQIGG